jgi:hypothetical protein
MDHRLKDVYKRAVLRCITDASGETDGVWGKTYIQQRQVLQHVDSKYRSFQPVRSKNSDIRIRIAKKKRVWRENTWQHACTVSVYGDAYLCVMRVTVTCIHRHISPFQIISSPHRTRLLWKTKNTRFPEKRKKWPWISIAKWTDWKTYISVLFRWISNKICTCTHIAGWWSHWVKS